MDCRRLCRSGCTVCVLLSLIAGVSLAGQTTQSASSPANQSGNASRGAIEFSQETLDNGLRVIYAPMHHAPHVNVRLAYHVGSKDDPPDHQGFAHLFEHMMFEGSAHVKSHEHERLLAGVGGAAWAMTQEDVTVYSDAVPSNQLDLALYLEADRLASFQVTQERLEIERKHVAEEIRTCQQEYRFVQSAAREACYTRHSYRWSTFGDMNHLADATVAELQGFFRRYYVPNNAVLVIAGDIDVATARQAVRRYFGWITRGKPIERDIPAEPPQTQLRRAVRWSKVPMSYLTIAWRLPPYASDEISALEILDSILGEGKHSRLGQTLRRGESALWSSSMSYVASMEDSSLFTLEGWVEGLLQANGVETAVLQEVVALVDKGVTQDELRRAQMMCRLEALRWLEGSSYIADRLARDACIAGDAGWLNHDLERQAAITVEDVQAVAKRYLRRENCTIVLVKPSEKAEAEEGARPAPASQSATQPVEPEVEGEAVEPPAIAFPKDYPNRPPVAEALVQPRLGVVERTVRGTKVFVMPDRRVPLVHALVMLRAGSLNDPSGKEGLAELTAQLSCCGVEGITEAAFREDLESRGIELYPSCRPDVTTLSVSCLPEHLDQAIVRLRQVLRQPTFPPEDFARRYQLVEQMSHQRGNLKQIAYAVLGERVFGDTPDGRTASPQSVAAITLDDVRSFHEDFYQPQDAWVIFGGDITTERSVELAQRLLDGWEPGDRPDLELPDPPALEKRRIVLVDAPDAVQSVIVVGAPACGRASPDWDAACVGGHAITWQLTDRLVSETGLASGAYAVFQSFLGRGAFVAAIDSPIAETGQSLGKLLEVLGDLRDHPVGQEELQVAKVSHLGSLAMAMDTLGDRAKEMMNLSMEGDPVAGIEGLPARLQAVTREQVQQVLQRYVDPRKMVIVVVAPAKKVRKQLRQFGQIDVTQHWATQ